MLSLPAPVVLTEGTEERCMLMNFSQSEWQWMDSVCAREIHSILHERYTVPSWMKSEGDALRSRKCQRFSFLSPKSATFLVFP